MVPFEHSGVCEFSGLDGSLNGIFIITWVGTGSGIDFLGLLLKCDLSKGLWYLFQREGKIGQLSGCNIFRILNYSY